MKKRNQSIIISLLLVACLGLMACKSSEPDTSKETPIENEDAFHESSDTLTESNSATQEIESSEISNYEVIETNIKPDETIDTTKIEETGDVMNSLEENQKSSGTIVETVSDFSQEHLLESNSETYEKIEDYDKDRLELHENDNTKETM